MSLARLFSRPQYTSEATDFITQLKKDHPQLHNAQLQGRARLWDKQLDRDLLAQFSGADIAQQPYVYMTGSDDIDN
jgi:hypothetical protein